MTTIIPRNCYPLLPQIAGWATFGGIMGELRRQVETRLAEVAALRSENAELKAHVAELQWELVRRKKGFCPKANTSTRTKSTQDRRKADERKHPAAEGRSAS